MIAEGTKAFNPQTGQTAVFTNGKWAVQGSQNVPLPQADDKAMEALQTQAQQAQSLDQKAQQFMRGMDPQRPGQPGFATGPALKHDFEVPLVHMDVANPIHAWVNARDPRLGALESVTNQAWTAMRPAGSGPMRMPEIEGFQHAFPNVEQYGPTNQGVANRLHQDAVIASQKLQFIDQFIRGGHGDYAGANAAWQAQGGGMNGPETQQQAPITPDGRFMPPPVQAQAQGSNPNVPAPGAGPQPGAIEDGHQFMGGNPGDPRNWRPAAAPMPQPQQVQQPPQGMPPQLPGQQ